MRLFNQINDIKKNYCKTTEGLEPCHFKERSRKPTGYPLTGD